MRNKRGSNVDKLTGYTGLGLRMAGDGKMRPAVVRPDVSKWKNAVERSPGMRPAVVRPDPRDLKKYFKNMKGKGLRMSGGECKMCGGSMNDKFLFADQAL